MKMNKKGRTEGEQGEGKGRETRLRNKTQATGWDIHSYLSRRFALLHRQDSDARMDGFLIPLPYIKFVVNVCESGNVRTLWLPFGSWTEEREGTRERRVTWLQWAIKYMKCTCTYSELARLQCHRDDEYFELPICIVRGCSCISFLLY